MKVISFYTDFYEEPAARLRSDLDKVGMKHAIVNVPDLGEWRRNVAFKPTFVADMLGETDEDLLYLDADTRVAGEMEFPEDCDIAVRYSEYVRQGKREPLCGAMFLRNTEKVREFIRKWESAMETADISLRRPEQQELRELLPESGLVVRELFAEHGRLAHEDCEAKIIHGRWTKEAGAPPISEEILEGRAEAKEEQQRVRGLVTLKRHNLHKKKRYQNTSHCKTSHWGKFGIPKGYRAAISLTFDDGRSTQFEYGQKILDEFDVKGTFYVCPALAQKQRWAWPRPAGNTIELASWSEILEASKCGHEIGNHTGTHPNLYKMVETLDREKRDANLKQEIDGSASAISRRIGEAYFTFAWPYHRQDARLTERIELKHTGIRPLQPRGVYNMKGSIKEWRRRMSGFVDKLLDEKSWGIGAIHDVAVGLQPLPEDILRWHIEDILKRGNVAIRTVNEMYVPYMAPMPPSRKNKPKAVKPKKEKPPKKSKQSRRMGQSKRRRRLAL